MPIDVDFRGRRVLLLGTDGRTAGTVHALLADGAAVTVAADELPTTLLDLADRALITHDPAADPRSFDVMLRAEPPVGDDTAITPEAPQAVVPAGSGTPDGVGHVVLLGGGPGDPGLITVAGLEALRSADVVVYDRLAPLSCLEQVRPEAELIDVGKIPRGEFTAQERINNVLVEHGLKGRTVVRFKGGDSFVFGRGGEEMLACAEAGIPVTVIPGVTSSVAAPALAGIPVTHRSVTQGFTVVSGHLAPGHPESKVDWAALARTGTTIVILMGVANLAAICRSLVEAGMDATTPAATIADAGLPSMATVRAGVADIADAVFDFGIGAPAVTVVGPVAALELVEGSVVSGDRGVGAGE